MLLCTCRTCASLSDVHPAPYSPCPLQAPAEEEPRRECETCGGTGLVECWCSRWSDGDGGCSTCRGSGRMVCASCRGGGTAVPVKARIYIDNRRSDNFRQGH